MKIESFIFRIDERYSAIDEEKINKFLHGKEIKRMRIGMLEGHEPKWSILIFYEESDGIDTGNTVEGEPIELNESERKIYESLRLWRNETAKTMGISAFMVMHNNTLKAIAKAAPTNTNELVGLKGIGPKKAEDYGEQVIEIIRGFTK